MAKNMKGLITFFCLIPLINLMGQEIYFSRDTLRIDNINYRDSIVIYNRGISLLKIDSIKCANTNYALSFVSNNQSYEWKTLEEYVNPDNAIEIPPNDSIKVRLSVAYFLVKQMKVNYDQIDTMYFYNNSINSPIQAAEITNKVVMGRVEDDTFPIEYSLSQNYPNPFNSSTTITYAIPENMFVDFRLHDCLGNTISILVHERQGPGTYSVKINMSNLASGIYFYRIIAGPYDTTKKMLLLK